MTDFASYALISYTVVFVIGLIFLSPLIVKVYRHESVKINKPIKGKNRTVLKAIGYIKSKHSNYFDSKIEKIIFLFLDENGNIVDEYLKSKDKRDSEGSCVVPWRPLQDYFSKKYHGIVSIHSHPRNKRDNNLMRGSWGDALVHKKMVKTFRSVTSLVVDTTISNFVEYDDKKNYIYQEG
jgi:hypothetical protein